MYSSQPASNEVVVYKRKKKSYTLTPYETLTSGFSKPMGMVTTPDGHWYVANSGASNVLVYRTTRSGPQGPKATLRDDGEVPVNVDATPNQRLVAVSNGDDERRGRGERERLSEPARSAVAQTDLWQRSGPRRGYRDRFAGQLLLELQRSERVDRVRSWNLRAAMEPARSSSPES